MALGARFGAGDAVVVRAVMMIGSQSCLRHREVALGKCGVVLLQIVRLASVFGQIARHFRRADLCCFKSLAFSRREFDASQIFSFVRCGKNRDRADRGRLHGLTGRPADDEIDLGQRLGERRKPASSK